MYTIQIVKPINVQFCTKMYFTANVTYKGYVNGGVALVMCSGRVANWAHCKDIII